MHQHDEHCGCGCGCGHDHGHDHDHHHGHDHEHIEIAPVEGLTIRQQNMLLALHERKYLPVACFSMTKKGEDSVYAVALAPVYLGSRQDTMEEVKVFGEELSQLEDAGYITLDYDIPLNGYGYAEYTESDLYAYFVKTVEEGKEKPGALFDEANLEKGSMALTEAGTREVEKMLPGQG